MAKFKSEFLNVAWSRGFIHQCTDEAALDAALMKGIVTSYNGYDCTARSLHVGHLMPMMLQRWFQKCGHRPIVLMGGGTTKIGDPSFRDESRPLLSDDEIDRNIESIRNVFSRLVTFGNKASDAIMVNNDHWLGGLHYIPFLREVGSHFTISRMLTFDSVQQRLDKGLTFLEFNYMILQAYDFLELKRRHNCILQTGGSDQWGNIVNGVELVRRIDGDEVFGLTTPLLTTASGAKMGKTAAGAVWLNADMLPVFDFWQYWRNTEDGDVGRFLRLFTELPLPEIAKLDALGGAEINEAKKILATEVTALVHGRAEADAAAAAARAQFETGEASGDLPAMEISKAKLASGVAAFDLLRELGLTKSGGEARRLIKGGGVRLNDAPLTEDERKITLADLGSDGRLKLSLGKKRHVLVKAV